MKALYYSGDKKTELRHVPKPIPDDGEYLIQMASCGICGSDFEGYLGKTGRRIPPMVMGHEGAGVIVQTPKDAKYPVGTRVVVFPNFYCGKCESCRNGLTNICDDKVFLGVMKNNGLMVEFVTAREEFLIPFDENLSFECAALTEPMAVAYDAAAKLTDEQIAGAESILVIGGGTIGLMILMMLKLRKAKRVVVSDPFDSRLALAKTLGADATLNPTKETFNEAVESLTDGKRFRFVFEAVGLSVTAESSIDALCTGGTAVWVGNADKMVQINMQKIVTTENKIMGSYTYTLDEFKECLELMAAGKVDATPLITDTYSLDDGVEAFLALENNPRGEKVKVMLRISDQRVLM